MKVKIERVGNTLLARLAGELDLKTAPVFREEVEQELYLHRDFKNLALDLGGVTFIDSSGLGAILGRYRSISQGGGRMIAFGLSPQVRKIFDLSGLSKIIDLYETEGQALKAL